MTKIINYEYIFKCCGEEKKTGLQLLIIHRFYIRNLSGNKVLNK